MVGCAIAAFVAALPTIGWRVVLAAGHPLGTPDAWRAVQDIPGSGMGYVLALSLLPLVAAAASFALVVDLRARAPRWVPAGLARRLPRMAEVAGLVGAGLLAMIVVMSILAWDRVDPFAGQVHDGWAWLCLVCHLYAVPWPPLLAALAVDRLRRS